MTITGPPSGGSRPLTPAPRPGRRSTSCTCGLGSGESQALYQENREQFYRRVRKGTQLVLGLIRSTMLHDTPMSFLWLGARLERVGQTARILDMHHHNTMIREGSPDAPGGIVEVALWLSLLKAYSGQEAFLKRHQGRVSARIAAGCGRPG